MIVKFFGHTEEGPQLIGQANITVKDGKAEVEWKKETYEVVRMLDPNRTFFMLREFLLSRDGKFDPSNPDHWAALPYIFHSWATFAQAYNDDGSAWDETKNEFARKYEEGIDANTNPSDGTSA